MKKTFTKLVTLAMLLACVGLSNAFAQTNLFSGLVGHYPFNGNANDVSGNVNNGIVNGATLTTDRYGYADSAYYFNGINNYITCSNSFPLSSTGSFTYNVWIQDDSLINSQAYVFERTTASLPLVDIYIGDSIPYFLFRTDGLSLTNLASPIKINNNWHFITIQRDYGNFFNIFVDTVLTAQFADDGSSLTPPTLAIGASPPNSSGYFKGKIDDISIYNRAINQAEIDSLYHNLWPANTNKPVANFTVTDSTIFSADSVIFTDISTNMPTSWKWSFPGGIPATSTQQNQTVRYNTSGTYSVTLIASNTIGSDTLIKNNYIEVQQASLNVGIIAYYPFNGNANDESGNGNNGIVNGATLTTDRYGYANSAFYFDGVNSDINDSNSFALNPTGSFTYNVWIQNDSLGSDAFVFDRTTATTPMVSLRVSDSIPIFEFRDDGGNLTNLTSSKKIDNNWHFITIQRDYGNFFNIFVDTVLTAQFADGGASLTPPTLTIGAMEGGAGAYFKGKIDDISIYNRAINRTEIDSLYNNNLVITGIKESTHNDFITIFPNPANNYITIEVPQQATIEITNIQGKLIKTLAAKSNKTNIDVSAFSSGVYFVKVKTEKGIMVKKFVKE